MVLVVGRFGFEKLFKFCILLFGTSMADYEVTDAEIIQIANSFLLASPPGEFMEVVTGTCIFFYFFFVYTEADFVLVYLSRCQRFTSR